MSFSSFNMTSSYSKYLEKKPKNYGFYAFLTFFIISCMYFGIFNAVFECIKFISWCIIAELSLRIAQTIEYDVNSKKKETKSTKILEKIWDFNNYSIYAMLGVAFLMSAFSMQSVLLDFKLLLPTISGYIFMKTINFSDSRYMKSLWIENSGGLDYGSGMAYNFFYGYLNIILPNRGDENYSIKELMNIYEDTENIKFGAKKLYLLIPRSLYCPPDLNDISKGPIISMEAAKSLNTIERNRAGVKKRIYKSSVYKIHVKHENKPVYVVVESCTPLLSLYETIKFDRKHKERYLEYSDEIILGFYNKLQDLISSNIECKDVCELVYFDDLDKDVNVGELLMQRLKASK